MPDASFLVLLTVGRNAPGVCRSAFLFASLAAVSGLDTTIYAVQEGADVFCRGALDDEAPEFEGAPTIASRLEEARGAGVRFMVCKSTADFRGMAQEDLIDDAKITGGVVLIELATSAQGVLSF